MLGERRLPVHPGKRHVDWELEDPTGRPVDEVRATRDVIARRVSSSSPNSTPA